MGHETKGANGMFAWLQSNLGTIVICLVLLLIVVAAVRSLVKDKKSGKSTCGSNCAHCFMAGSCHDHK